MSRRQHPDPPDTDDLDELRRWELETLLPWRVRQERRRDQQRRNGRGERADMAAERAAVLCHAVTHTPIDRTELVDPLEFFGDAGDEFGD